MNGQGHDKPFATLAAQFTLRGYTLTRATRADDGHITYTVSRWNQSRTFSHLHDLQAFLVQIGGAHEL